jgi:hypothetical protein
MIAMERGEVEGTFCVKDFLEDAKKTRIDVEPLDGTKVQQTVERLYATPKAIVDKAKQAMTPQV